MNEPAIRTEEQIISLFPDRETLICRGWVLKRMEGQLLVYPLYYKFSEGDIPENIRRCEEISRQCGAGCVFRIVEHTNYHLSSILTDNGYGLEKCGVVDEWNLTGDAGKLCMEGRENAGRAVPEKRERRDGLPEQYGRRGFCRAYLYRRYQKNQEEKSFRKED